MRSSLRAALIGWFAALLAAVLLAFGALLYAQAAETTLDGVDAALEARARALAGALEWDEQDGLELELSDDYLAALAADGDFRVWSADGTSLRAGGGDAPEAAAGVDGWRTRDERRELELAGPYGARVTVGRSIAPELARLAALRRRVTAAGLGVLALALVGGWLLARRSLAPVAELAATAEGITARDLSARLDEARSPAELRGLARAFNGTLARLESAFARQARFTADASHELRTPIAVVRAQAELALRRAREPHEYRTALEACARAAERMGRLVDALLALAREDALPERAFDQPVALDELARQSAALLMPLAEEAHVELRCAAEPAQVLGDPSLLADVVANLIDNGLRYNRPGGRVDVLVERENGCALVRVRDDGIGIPAEEQAHVFERFYRVDPARSRARGGAGLGLSIARGIVEAHGGTLELESAPGAGSTFTVRLPVGGELEPQNESAAR